VRQPHDVATTLTDHPVVTNAVVGAVDPDGAEILVRTPAAGLQDQVAAGSGQISGLDNAVVAERVAGSVASPAEALRHLNRSDQIIV